MPAVLAVDLGKTSCRAALWPEHDASAPIRSADAAGAPGLAVADGVALAERAIAMVCQHIFDGIEPPASMSICVGAAGALAAPDARGTLAGRLSALIPTGVFAIGSDAVIAHAGALNGRPGLVLNLGTGAVVLGAAAGAGLIQVDGWGPLLGDLGSGGWIGRIGLQAALAAFDGRGPTTALLAAAESEHGAADRLPAGFDGRPDSAREAARFAPTVARLAHDGDQVSVGILRTAARHLADSVAAAERRLSEHGESRNRLSDYASGEAHRGGEGDPARTVLALTGGLVALGPPLLEPLTAAIGLAAPNVRIQPPAGTSLDGARRLATDHDTVLEPLLLRTENTASNPSSVHTCPDPDPEPAGR